MFASESDNNVAFDRYFHAFVMKYGIDMIEKAVRKYKGVPCITGGSLSALKF